MVPKMDSLSLRHFGLPPAQPLRVASVDPTDRYLRAWQPTPPCPQFDHYACFLASSPSFPLFPQPPSPLSSWRNEMLQLRSCSLEPNLTVIREGSEDTHLHAVLPISISQAEQIRLGCSLLRCVHRWYMVSHSFEHRTRDSYPR